jgi:hypothetical protein
MRHEQMYVIGRPHVSVDFADFVQGDLTQITPVAFVVARSEEARLSIVAALDDVLRDMRNVDARRRGMLWRARRSLGEFDCARRRGL